MSALIVGSDRNRLAFVGLLFYLGLDFLRPHDVLVGLRAYRPMLVVGAATAALTVWQHRPDLRSDLRPLLPLFILAAAATLSAFGSVDPNASLLALLEVGKMIVLVWMVSVLVTTASRLTAVLWVICTALAVLAVAAIVQGIDSGLMREWDPHKAVIGPPGNHDGALRDNNNLARVFAMAMPLWWAQMVLATSAWRRGLAATGAILIVVGLEFTFSRGGFIALMGGATVLAVTHRPLWRGLAMLVAFTIALLVLSPNAYLEHMGTLAHPMTQTSLSKRFEIWRGAGERSLRHWLQGQGVGTFEFRDPASPPTSPLPLASHNIFVEAVTELGVLGLAALLWVWSDTFYRLHQVRRREARDGVFLRTASIGVEAALGAYLVASLALSSAFQSPPFVLIGLALALRRQAAGATV